MKSALLVSSLVCLLLLCFTQAADAANGSTQEIRPLTFGQLDVIGSTIQQIVMQPNGTEINDPGILVVHKGSNGVYRLYNYSAGLAVTLTIADTTLDQHPSGSPSFEIKDFTFDPAGAGQVTDGSGELIVNIGATLETHAATIYTTGGYRGTYTLMINF